MKLVLLASFLFTAQAFAKIEVGPEPSTILTLHSVAVDDGDDTALGGGSKYEQIYGFDDRGRVRLRLWFRSAPLVEVIDPLTGKVQLANDALTTEDYATLRKQLQLLPRNEAPKFDYTENKHLGTAPAVHSDCPATLALQVIESDSRAGWAPFFEIKSIKIPCRDY